MEALKVAFLSIVLVALLAGGAMWFDNLGVFEYFFGTGIRQAVFPALGRLPVVGEFFMVARNKADEIDRQEIDKRITAMKEERESLKKYGNELKEKSGNLEDEYKKLTSWDSDLHNRETKIEENRRKADSYEENIERLASYYINMKPEDAVKIMTELDDNLLVDVLKAITRKDPDIATLVLTKMDPARAGQISRKIGLN